MTTVTIEEAQARLPELIERLGLGDELTILKGSIPVAEITPIPDSRLPVARGFGCCKDLVISYVEDDEHLKDFEEYMS